MTTPARSRAVDSVERWLLPAGVAAALILGIVGIGRFLRLDEANSVIIASSGFSRLLEYLRNDNNLPFYYLLLHIWIRLAGISEWAVHLPSVVFYLVAIVVV
jgi:mannosyltransferase